MRRQISTAVLVVAVFGWAGTVQADVADGGFEAGQFGGVWTEASTNFGSPICSAGLCGTGGGTGAHSGTYWSWFGGIAAYEASSVSQNVTILPGEDLLRFYLEIPAADGAGNDYLNVSLDGATLFSVSDLDAATYPTYSLVTLDISAYADGGSHLLSFDSEIFGANGVTNFFVDDVSISMIPAPGAALLAMLGFPAVGWVKRRLG